jgi:hypothetical protein
MANPQEPFFVGWGKVPKALRFFLASCAALLVVGFGVMAYATSATQTDTGSGAFMGRTMATGVLQEKPYPILHVIESPHFERGETIILSGGGKRGAVVQATGLDGQIVEANGVRMDRGDLHGMQLRNGRRGLKAAEDQAQSLDISIEKLGRWKLHGEICDGKCLNGAMRPGTGLAHRACAILCLLGDVAPVFVSSGPLDGDEFLLISGPDGGPITQALLEYTALLVEVEGAVERHGSMLVFKIDPETIKVVR